MSFQWQNPQLLFSSCIGLFLLDPPWEFYYWSETVWLLCFLPISLNIDLKPWLPRSWLLTTSALGGERLNGTVGNIPSHLLSCSEPLVTHVIGCNTPLFDTLTSTKNYPVRLRLPGLKMHETSIKDSKCSLKWRLYLFPTPFF